jgi:hypothetical protein
MMVQCRLKHDCLKDAGIYKRNRRGNFVIKKGERVYLKKTWACPFCHRVFIKPKFRYRRFVKKEVIRIGKLNHRTVRPLEGKRNIHHSARPT